MIRSELSVVRGPNIEVGAGHGSYAENSPDVISCDIATCPWLDCAADACHLPFRAESLSNIIMIDVLHHLADPIAFFSEAMRTLAPGGRVLMIEPYTSPLSWIAWRYFHDEHIDMSADLFSEEVVAEPAALPPIGSGAVAKDPWDANTAIPTLMFWREIGRFRERFPELSVVQRDRFDLLLYPLSGGFEQRPLIPSWCVPTIRWLERSLRPLARMMAFRCMIVVEKADD